MSYSRLVLAISSSDQKGRAGKTLETRIYRMSAFDLCGDISSSDDDAASGSSTCSSDNGCSHASDGDDEGEV